jgi:dTDP-6-deoxy-L-talose 4-dehydrogenase (NAD+)
VVNELLKFDHQLIIATSHPYKIKYFHWPTELQIVEVNLGHLDTGQNYFAKLHHPDIVLHLAWQGLPNYMEPFHVEKNLPVQIAFLKNLIQHGLRQLVVTGTCFEYGMKEGCLSEDMETAPTNYYAIAKDELRKNLEELQERYPFALKWIRLFYMYGKGQNPKSLLSQLEDALKRGDKVFNMSGGEQLRDYLPIEKAGEYIIKIAFQSKVNGIINCCSGNPISVKQLVQNYLKGKEASIDLNTGFYPYPDYEPMAFWGDKKKLKSIIENE